MSVMEVWDYLPDEQKQQVISELSQEFIQIIHERVERDGFKGDPAGQSGGGNTYLPPST